MLLRPRTQGVIAAIDGGDAIGISASADTMAVALGVLPKTQSLASLTFARPSLCALSEMRSAGCTELSALAGGYHTVQPGGVFRSEKFPLSSILQADIVVVTIDDPTDLDVFVGNATVFTGPVADSDKRYLLSALLPELDHNIVEIFDSGECALTCVEEK